MQEFSRFRLDLDRLSGEKYPAKAVTLERAADGTPKKIVAHEHHKPAQVRFTNWTVVFLTGKDFLTKRDRQAEQDGSDGSLKESFNG